MKPRVSVITPVYNCSEYLRESIESILAQTMGDFEFIIINDGSTDDTVDIVESFKDERIVFINNDKNRKLPTRRNEAIGRATADLVAIHDGDDISLPDRFSLQLKAWDDLDDSHFCLGGHALKISSSGKLIGAMSYPPDSVDELLYKVMKECTNPIIDPSTMFRRDYFLSLKKYSLEKAISTVTDYDLWLRALLKGLKITSLQTPLVKYRVNPLGMTRSNNSLMSHQHITVWKRFMRTARQEGLKPQGKYEKQIMDR